MLAVVIEDDCTIATHCDRIHVEMSDTTMVTYDAY